MKPNTILQNLSKNTKLIDIENDNFYINVVVVIDAYHKCVSIRGVEDQSNSTVTSSYHGRFEIRENRNEFLKLLS